MMKEFRLLDSSRQMIVVVVAAISTLTLMRNNCVHETDYLILTCPLAITVILRRVFAQLRVRVFLHRCVTLTRSNALLTLFLFRLVKMRKSSTIPVPCAQEVFSRFLGKVTPHALRLSHRFHRRFAPHNAHVTGTVAVTLVHHQPTQ